MRERVRNISIALSICLALGVTIWGVKNSNNIYTSFLGDVPALYWQADSMYKHKNYQEAAAIYSKLARMDSAKHCQYILGDIYFQGKTGVKDYKKAMELFTKSADNGYADSQNNVSIRPTPY